MNLWPLCTCFHNTKNRVNDWSILLHSCRQDGNLTCGLCFQLERIRIINRGFSGNTAEEIHVAKGSPTSNVPEGKQLVSVCLSRLVMRIDYRWWKSVQGKIKEIKPIESRKAVTPSLEAKWHQLDYHVKEHCTRKNMYNTFHWFFVLHHLTPSNSFLFQNASTNSEKKDAFWKNASYQVFDS